MNKPPEQVWLDGAIAENTWQNSPDKCVAPHGPYILSPRWQQIDTAPKDGTECLAHMRGSLVPIAVRFVSKEYLARQYGDENYIESGWYYSYGYAFNVPEYPINDYITHWMPLPEPPTGDTR